MRLNDHAMLAATFLLAAVFTLLAGRPLVQVAVWACLGAAFAFHARRRDEDKRQDQESLPARVLASAALFLLGFDLGGEIV